MILTAFNLLPALPLDGGQIFAELAAAAFGGRRGMRLAELAGLLTGALLLAAGLWLMWTGMGAAVLVASIWLLLSQPENPALGRRKELL